MQASSPEPIHHSGPTPRPLRRQFDRYDPDDARPLGAYTALTATFAGLAAAAVYALRASDRPLPRPRLRDSLRLGVATHKLARLVAKDKVTSPYRAPFVRFQDTDGAAPAEVEEAPRGSGFRYAIGELIGCPYCLAPWIATGLLVGEALAPEQTRALTSVMAIVTVSDWMQILYKGSERKLL